MRARFEFKPQDFWVGAFWKFQESRLAKFQDQYGRIAGHVVADRDLWLTLVPMFPLHISWLDHRCRDSLRLSPLTKPEART